MPAMIHYAVPPQIAILESVGADASIRHARAEELQRILAAAHASEALCEAASSGDVTALKAELGIDPMVVTQSHDSPVQGLVCEDD